MELVESADGTRIAFIRVGEGDPVVVVGGAFSTHESGLPLVEALAALGYQGVAYDRRARAGSGDTPPYAPFREAEDLTAVIEGVGGRAAVLGHSSGAVLSLFAAGEGAPISHLFLSEPPFHFGVDSTPDGMVDRLQSLVDAGNPEEVVSVFQGEVVGLPPFVVDQIRSSPMFAGLVPLAQSVVYDTIITTELDSPTPAMTGTSVPVTILRGEPTYPFLVSAVERLAAAMPSAELVVVPESHDHGVDPPATARLVASRL